MLTENKFSKYLLYAIGEIILVVIGILIALQINNSNELSKQNRLVETYENSLISELKIDLENIKRSDSLNTASRKRQIEYLNYYRK
jgi:sensor domain CHASE-containing protein